MGAVGHKRTFGVQFSRAIFATSDCSDLGVNRTGSAIGFQSRHQINDNVSIVHPNCCRSKTLLSSDAIKKLGSFYSVKRREGVVRATLKEASDMKLENSLLMARRKLIAPAALILICGPSLGEQVTVTFDDLETNDDDIHLISNYRACGIEFTTNSSGIRYGDQSSEVYRGSAAIWPAQAGYLLVVEAPPGKTLTGGDGNHLISFDYADLCGNNTPNGYCINSDRHAYIDIRMLDEEGNEVGHIMQGQDPLSYLPAFDGFQPYVIPREYSSADVHKIELFTTTDLRQFDNFSFDIPNHSCSIQVAIDIKPGSEPNCFNINDHGVIPVAILGSETFDAEDVDDSTLSFGGLEVRVRGNKGPLCGVEDANGDGFTDLVCHFEDDPSNWDVGEAAQATLSGMTLEGERFEGTGAICIVP